MGGYSCGTRPCNQNQNLTCVQGVCLCNDPTKVDDLPGYCGEFFFKL